MECNFNVNSLIRIEFIKRHLNLKKKNVRESNKSIELKFRILQLRSMMCNDDTRFVVFIVDAIDVPMMMMMMVMFTRPNNNLQYLNPNDMVL